MLIRWFRKGHTLLKQCRVVSPLYDRSAPSSGPFQGLSCRHWSCQWSGHDWVWITSAGLMLVVRVVWWTVGYQRSIMVCVLCTEIGSYNTAAPWTSLVKLSWANIIPPDGACLPMPAQFIAVVSFGWNSPCVWRRLYPTTAIDIDGRRL